MGVGGEQIVISVFLVATLYFSFHFYLVSVLTFSAFSYFPDDVVSRKGYSRSDVGILGSLNSGVGSVLYGIFASRIKFVESRGSKILCMLSCVAKEEPRGAVRSERVDKVKTE